MFSEKTFKTPELREANPETTQGILATPGTIPQATTKQISNILRQNNGRPNIGNTCNFNSLVQAFWSLPNLKLNDLPIPFKQMHELIFEDQNNHEYIPIATQVAFSNLNAMINNKLVLGEQEDCHDSISSFLATKFYV